MIEWLLDHCGLFITVILATFAVGIYAITVGVIFGWMIWKILLFFE